MRTFSHNENDYLILLLIWILNNEKSHWLFKSEIFLRSSMDLKGKFYYTIFLLLRFRISSVQKEAAVLPLSAAQHWERGRVSLQGKPAFYTHTQREREWKRERKREKNRERKTKSTRIPRHKPTHSMITIIIIIFFIVIWIIHVWQLVFCWTTFQMKSSCKCVCVYSKEENVKIDGYGREWEIYIERERDRVRENSVGAQLTSIKRVPMPARRTNIRMSTHSHTDQFTNIKFYSIIFYIRFSIRLKYLLWMLSPSWSSKSTSVNRHRIT